MTIAYKLGGIIPDLRIIINHLGVDVISHLFDTSTLA